MLCARVSAPPQPRRKAKYLCCAPSKRCSKRSLEAYEWSLERVLAYKSVMLLVTFATLVGTVVLYKYIPKGFFPQEDTGFISGSTEGQSRHRFPGDG